MVPFSNNVEIPVSKGSAVGLKKMLNARRYIRALCGMFKISFLKKLHGTSSAAMTRTNVSQVQMKKKVQPFSKK
jgi:hypothetical protein